MKENHHKAYHGQVVILLVAALVVILGFTALAINVAMVYSDRRNAKNAADAAALAGAGMAGQYLENRAVTYKSFNCANAEVISSMNTAVISAIGHAQTNNFEIDSDTTDLNGVQVTCSVQKLGPFLEQFIFVKVMITAPTNANFALLFYSGDIKNTVQSITRVRPRTNLAFGYSIASLGNYCTEGRISAVGNVNVKTTHGSLFSNSCMIFNGNVDIDSSDLLSSGIHYYSTLTSNGAVSLSPAPIKSPMQIPKYILQPPDCSLLPVIGDVTVGGNLNQTLFPGQYSSLTITGTSEVTLSPGCIVLQVTSS
jgi:hypothetical protein